MRRDLKRLLDLFEDGQYHTAIEIAEYLGVSPKTARTRIREMESAGKKYGIHVVSKPRYGYILITESNDSICKMQLAIEQQEGLPDSSEERTGYLLVYLLNHEGYTKIEELAEFLCVSRSTVQISLKEAEYILIQYNIQIERKPNYGIRTIGNEFDIRRCIGECFVKCNMLGNSMQIYKQGEIEYLAEIVLNLTEKYEINLLENALENFVAQLYVAMKRIRYGYYIQLKEKEVENQDETVYRLSGELAEELSRWQNITYTPSEIKYISIYLKGNRMIGNMENVGSNFIIREELDGLVMRMIELIFNDYGINLRNNFNLRMSMNQHMVPFDIRMRYHIKIQNPILEQIRQNYIFGYTLASRCCSILEQHYGRQIPEDEVGYFAMLLVCALEQRGADEKKASILIVCSAGRGSSQLLRYKYEHEFKESLDRVYVCGLYELTGFDFSKVDYVFTTVPIHQRIPVPITEVGQFFGKDDVLKVREVLRKGHMDFLDEYYVENHFLVNVEGSTKEEVIKNICVQIERERNLPKGFYEAVLKREELAQTDFGNYVAMPHPYKIITDDTFIYVAILKEEIIWTTHPVQFVILSAICGKEDNNLPMFYEVTTNLFMREDMIRRIINEKDFSIFMQMLRQIYYME